MYLFTVTEYLHTVEFRWVVKAEASISGVLLLLLAQRWLRRGWKGLTAAPQPFAHRPNKPRNKRVDTTPTPSYTRRPPVTATPRPSPLSSSNSSTSPVVNHQGVRVTTSWCRGGARGLRAGGGSVEGTPVAAQKEVLRRGANWVRIMTVVRRPNAAEEQIQGCCEGDYTIGNRHCLCAIKYRKGHQWWHDDPSAGKAFEILSTTLLLKMGSVCFNTNV